MYALRVCVNSEEPIVAGASDLCVLNTIINCVGKLGEATVEVRERQEVNLFLTVGGLTSRKTELPDEHVQWVSNRPLKVGDVIGVEIIETQSADAHISGSEAAKRKHDEREYFEHCKKIYLKLREKYEI